MILRNTPIWNNRLPINGLTNINYNHPLAYGLQSPSLAFSSGGGVPVDLVKNVKSTPTNTPTWVNSQYGPAMKLVSGSSQYVKIASSNNINSNLSVSLLVYPTAITSHNRLVYLSDATNNIQIVLDTDGLWKTQATPIDANTSGFKWGTPALNAWYHLVFTVLAGTSTNLYINGIVGSGTSFVGGMNNATQDSSLYVGIRSDLNAVTASDCWVSQVLIYNRILTSQEVQQLYLDPFCFLQPTNKRIYVNITSSSFKAAWARSSNQVIGSGYVS